MVGKLLTSVFLLIIVATPVFAGELYQVKVQNYEDAEVLARSGSDAILKIKDGYLVLCNDVSASVLLNSNLEIKKLTDNIERNQMAISHNLGQAKIQTAPLIFEEDEVRLYKVDLPQELVSENYSGLAPLMTDGLKIEFHQSSTLNLSNYLPDVSLDSLINLVELDSLRSYTLRLQAFYRRYAGTDSNYVSRDWIAGKLSSFGYDSIAIDSFVATIGGVPKNCQNVLAYKIGTEFPQHHVIVGAHRDAVSNSPGADDNGSGTAGVLEFARVLKDIPTKTTIIFALFDAEEQGLLGSWHYVNEAKPRGDSIVYMLNMDMIANISNTNQAKLHHGTDTTYSHLWIELADSLVGITGYLSGSSSGSDHYPFVQNGYPGTFVFEYNFSSVYHSPQDSTSYMNFLYMTQMVQASIATVYVVGSTYEPTGAITFDYPNGTPNMILPRNDTTFEVAVSGSYDKVPRQNSGAIYYSINSGQYTNVPMTELSPNYYRATLPSMNCYDKIKYYISVADTSGSIHYSPGTINPFTSVVATEEIRIFEDNFETDLYWLSGGTTAIGQWGRGIPNGGGDRGDPPTDYDGSGYCYATGNYDGDSDVDGGIVTLTSPAFDLSMGDGQIQYARWYSNNAGADPYNDVMRVYISNDDGLSWTTAETIGPVEQASGGWFLHTFWASEFTTPTNVMRLRFEASDLGSGSLVEAAVDAVLIRTYNCIFYICGDANGNEIVNIQDVTYLINYLYKGGAAPSPIEAGDANGNGIINIQDVTYLITFLYKDGPEPVCP